MSLSLSIAIHKALSKGMEDFLPPGGAPYAGCYVPHSRIVRLPECWELSPDNEYDCHTSGPEDLCSQEISFEASEGGFGWIYCYDGDCASCFRIQRKE